jgi:endonuclease I
MNKRLLLQAVLTMLFTCAWAQGPNDTGEYYQNANGKSGAALKTALHNIISKKKKSPSYDDLLELYKKTDTRADGYVRDWYSNITNFTHITDKAGSYQKEGDVYNREHSVPQSWGAPKADIVHVVPTDGYVNNRRGNLPFGEVANVKYASANDYSKMGTCKTEGYNGNVFEPNDEVKGDLARIYFYMATCYEGSAHNWGNSVFTGTAYKPFSDWTYNMLIRWSQLDPVDEVEIARNDSIFLSNVQGNRNPFVDYPGLEDYIWGDKKDVPFSYDNYNGGEQNYVARPVIRPDAGTYYESIEVTITSATEGASIYYTLNGEDASEQSILYEGPITLDVYGTYEIRAIAIKDGNRSAQASATYTVKEQPQPGDDVEIALNNAFFGITTTSTIAASISEDFVKEENGVTFIYALGTGQQRYANANEIRLYKNNKLTVSVASGTIVGLDFTIGDKNSELSANTGVFNGFSWTGDAKEVEITSAGNTALRKVVVKLANGASGIDMVETDHHQRLDGYRVIYDLSGRRVTNPTRGLYIVDGRKVFIP